MHEIFCYYLKAFLKKKQDFFKKIYIYKKTLQKFKILEFTHRYLNKRLKFF